jgi:SAM-dependent methyltransferase
MRGLWRVRHLVHTVKTVTSRTSLAFPRRVECNLCGWRGRRFLSDSWHPHTVCPRCSSQVRHRLLVAALTHVDGLSAANLVRGRHVLHFAPEPVLASILRSGAARYVSADYKAGGVDLRLDISKMPSIKDEEFDLVIACDVLEHVPDDRRALYEISRILRRRGHLILTVPQKDHLEETFEDPSVVDPERRAQLFGQSDHLRIYGDSFPGLLESVGFQVEAISASSFSSDLVKRHILFPPILSTHPLATNYRKIFFAAKT